MEYRITHTTTYRYGESVSSSQNIAHLLPRRLPPAGVPAVRSERNPEPAAAWRSGLISSGTGSHSSRYKSRTGGWW